MFKLRILSALAICVFAACSAGCASSGGTAPTSSAAANIDAASQTATAASNAAGPITRILRSVGLKKAPPPPTSYALPVRIFTADNLNAGNGKQPLALVLKVYQLRSVDQFEQTPFNDFLEEDKTRNALGDSLIKQRTMLLLPGQRYESTEQLPTTARYIGFVALFRGPAPSRWRFVYDVQKSTVSGVTLGVHACALSSTAGALVTQLADPADSLASVHCPNPGS